METLKPEQNNILLFMLVDGKKYIKDISDFWFCNST